MSFVFLEPFLKPGIFFFFNCLIATIIIILSFFFSESKPYVEKVSAYECGFEPDEDARNIFDIRFYIVAMLFLVFDLEAIYFFP
jgi:NADH-quinone oxidoreductase subunit A